PVTVDSCPVSIAFCSVTVDSCPVSIAFELKAVAFVAFPIFRDSKQPDFRYLHLSHRVENSTFLCNLSRRKNNHRHSSVNAPNDVGA
ncbi:MAG: hypothetical protein WCH34_18145, partial [Bacteroidota bacterium]